MPSRLIVLSLVVAIGWAQFCSESLAQRSHETVSLSDRVGSVIGPEAREYFGLFPRFDRFVSAATLRGDGDAAISVVVTSHDGSRLDTVHLSSDVAAELGRYIDQFEQLRYRTERVQWHLLWPHVEPAGRGGQGAAIRVMMDTGEVIRAHVMQATPDALVLSTRRSIARQPVDTTAIVVVTPFEIEKVSTGGVLGGLSDDSAIRVDGSVERYRRLVVPRLAPVASSQAALSPEAAALRDQIVVSSGIQSYVETAVVDLEVNARTRPWQMAISHASHPRPLAPSGLQDGYGGAIDIPTQFSLANVAFRIDYTATDRWSVGVYGRISRPSEMPVLPTGEIMNRTDSSIENVPGVILAHVSEGGLQLGFDILPVRRTPVPVNWRESIRLRLGAGPTLAHKTTRAVVFTGETPAANQIRAIYSMVEQERLLFGVASTVELDVFVQAGLSLGVTSQITHYFDVDGFSIEVIPMNPPRYAKSLERSSGAMTLFAVGPHLRLHL